MRRMRTRMVPIILAVTAGLGSAWAATAADLNFKYYAYGVLYDSNDFPVGGGAAYPRFLDYTATNSQITFTYTNDTLWGASTRGVNFDGFEVTNGALITDPNLKTITAVTLDPASVTPGPFGPGDFAYDGDAVAVSWQNQFFANGTKIVLDVTGVPVPEPASWVLMLTGVAALGGVLRRSRRWLLPA